MGRWTAERWAASSGILFAILLVVSNFLAGTPPHYNASSSSITGYLADHHQALVIQGICGGVLIVLFLWFLATYAGMYREGGQGRLATIMYGAGVVMVCLAAVGGTIMMSLVQLHTTLTTGLLTGMYGMSVFFYMECFWALAALAFASYLANHRTHVFPEWYTWLSGLGCVCFVLTAVSVRMHGFFSPSGAMVRVGLIVFASWVFLASWLCMQKHAVHSHAMSPAHSH